MRMLGAGRPFAFEVQNARKCVFTAAFFRDVEARLQQVSPCIRHLRCHLLPACMWALSEAEALLYPWICCKRVFGPVAVSHRLSAALH